MQAGTNGLISKSIVLTFSFCGIRSDLMVEWCTLEHCHSKNNILRGGNMRPAATWPPVTCSHYPISNEIPACGHVPRAHWFVFPAPATWQLEIILGKDNWTPAGPGHSPHSHIQYSQSHNTRSVNKILLVNINMPDSLPRCGSYFMTRLKTKLLHNTFNFIYLEGI